MANTGVRKYSPRSFSLRIQAIFAISSPASFLIYILNGQDFLMWEPLPQCLYLLKALISLAPRIWLFLYTLVRLVAGNSWLMEKSAKWEIFWCPLTLLSCDIMKEHKFVIQTSEFVPVVQEFRLIEQYNRLRCLRRAQRDVWRIVIWWFEKTVAL